MRIFLVASAVPFPSHGQQGVTATHLVTSALLTELKKRGHTIILQCLFDQSRARTASVHEEKRLEQLRGEGVEVLPPISVLDYPAPPMKRLRIFSLLHTQTAIRHFYRGYQLRGLVRERIRQATPDVIVPVWSIHGVAATHGITDVPRVAYHGDIDHLPMQARLVHDYPLFYGKGGGFFGAFRLAERRMHTSLFGRAHIALMQDLDGIANIAACNAEYYRRKGHRHSEYTRNTWPATAVAEQTPTTDAGKRPKKIIGHVGYLNRTGSTYGLRYFLQHVVPLLPAVLSGIPYEVHIIGGSEPFPEIRSLLEQPNIVRHGFVEDLDRELRSSDVFCLFNNAAPYQSAYTRHLVAWSNRLCLVTHALSALAIPELKDGENALVCSDPITAAISIARACSDPVFNQRIRDGGRRTFESCFTAEIVAGRLEKELLEAVERRRAFRSA